MTAHHSAYRPSKAPAVLISEAAHNATRGVFNTFRVEIAQQQGVSIRQIDWAQVSPETALRLADEQFKAAKVPQHVVDEYFRQFNEYLGEIEGL